MEKLLRHRNAASVKFRRKINAFKCQARMHRPHEVLSGFYLEVSEAFKSLEEIHERYLQQLCESEEEEFHNLIKSAESYIEEFESEKDKMHNILIECQLNVNTQQNQIKVKRLDAPTFDGDIRKFPTFKTEYGRIMNKAYNRDAFALRQSLLGDAAKVVLGVEDDYNEMMRRLDAYYGDPCKLIDCIINDIKQLKEIPEGDNRKFIETVNIIERAFLDLKRLNLEKEMSSVSILSIIEKILPLDQKREWIKLYKNLENKEDAFIKLLKYLISEKEILEHMDKDIRSNNTSYKASINKVEIEEDLNIVSAIKQMQIKQNNMETLLQQMSAVNKIEKYSDKTNQVTNNYCWYHQTYNHSIYRCQAFHNLDNYIKFEVMKKNGTCFRCLGAGHVSKECNETRFCIVKDQYGNVCGKPHHPKLHYLFFNQYVKKSLHTNYVMSNAPLLTLGIVYCKGYQITTLYDSASSVSLITHSLARQLGLTSTPVNITITKIGNTVETLESKIYNLSLIDKFNNNYAIACYGMDEITSNVPRINIEAASKIFDLNPSIKLSRPYGRVDLLIGLDYCTLLPQVVKSVGNLQLMQNVFGYCVRGSHLLINESNSYNAKIYHVNITPAIDEINFDSASRLKDNLDMLFESDDGKLTKNHCEKCQNCYNYSKEMPITIKQKQELDLILKGLSYDEINKYWTIAYPWIKSPHLLPNNYVIACIKLKGTEKRLKKLGDNYSNLYSDSIVDMLNRNVGRKLSEVELKSYKGPIHYVSHHEIIKASSSSTPFRIVFNSSASYNGHILNEYWAKGPDVLNSLFGVLIRFCENVIAFTGDVFKMFNAIKLSLLDQHTHRFLWRDMDENRRPDHYVLTAVPFGDKPSGSIAILAMKKTAELNKYKLPDAYNIIDRDSYVDDIIHSTNTVENAKRCMKEIDEVLAEGGFQIKNWVISGDPNCEDEINIITSEVEMVLGLVWKPKSDVYQFKVKLNFHKKFKGIYSGPYLSKENFQNEFPETITKRQAFSQISTVYDPLGFVSPFLLKGKLIMRKIVTSKTNDRKLEWDDPLPTELKNICFTFFLSLFDMENLIIPRCWKFEGCSDPSLVVFSDASTLAYGACAYIRWKIEENTFKCKLIASKCRLSPIRAQTIPKLELNSALLGVRLRCSILEESTIEFKNFYHLTDSEIVHGQISKDDIKIGTYVANRIVEIRENTSANEWFWIPGELNIADIITRPDSFSDIGCSSTWQQGPEFLNLPIEEWNVKESKLFEFEDISKINIMSSKIVLNVPNMNMFQIDRFNTSKKLIRVTARVINIIKKKSFKAVLSPPSSEEIRIAELAWIKYSQYDIAENWDIRFRRLGPFKENEIIHVGSRILNWMKNNWNNDSFILLPCDHEFTKLFVKDMHDIDHAGIESTIAKIQSRFWIPKVRVLLRNIKNRCVVCRYLDKITIGQSMGPLPEKRLKPSPPFYNSALDLFGPFLIKDTVKGRCRKKVFGVIINCLVTRASYIDLVEGYDADSFLTTLRRFVSIRGYPKTMYSDSGTQLKLANKELQAMAKEWNLNNVTEFGSNEGMTWSFTKSADAPWENGCSEAMVKLIKKAMTRVIGTTILTFSELQTVLFEISNLLNSRPIGLKPGSDPDRGAYLCPNDLLLGRASINVPNYSVSSSINVKARQNFINEITNSFWKRWMRDYFHTLIVRQKWHQDKRNLQSGDIVLVADSKVIKGTWRLAQVCDIIPSSDNKVRDVKIRYKIQKENNSYDGIKDTIITRSVHRLVLILPIEEQ